MDSVRGNITRLRGQLLTDIDPKKQYQIRKLLIEEEDKLGSHSELLDDLYEQIARGRELIAWHNVLVKSTAHNGYVGAAEAESLLVRLKDSQDLHEKYLKRKSSIGKTEGRAAGRAVELAGALRRTGGARSRRS